MTADEALVLARFAHRCGWHSQDPALSVALYHQLVRRGLLVAPMNSGPFDGATLVRLSTDSAVVELVDALAAAYALGGERAAREAAEALP